jgi:hypothetical protein
MTKMRLIISAINIDSTITRKCLFTRFTVWSVPKVLTNAIKNVLGTRLKTARFYGHILFLLF